MMYPRKTPQQAKKAELEKKLETQKRRDQLLALISPKHKGKDLENIFQSSIKPSANSFAVNQTSSLEMIKPVNNLTHGRIERNREQRTARSDDSRMSGASEDPQQWNEADLKKQSKVFEIFPSVKKSPAKAWKNEEEEWAELYRQNIQAYNAELELEKEKKMLNKIKMKHELDEQIELNKGKKMRQLEEKRIEHERVMRKVQLEEAKEKKKQELAHYKNQIEHEMISRQIKDNKAQRKHDLKERKEIDRMIIERVRGEQEEEDRLAKKKRDEDLLLYRRMLKQSQEKRQLIFQAKEEEKKQEMLQIQAYNKMVEEREKAREADLKAKDERIRRTLEIARELIGKPRDEREKKQDDKIKKWVDMSGQEEELEERMKREEANKRRLELKNVLDQQILEKKQREALQREDRQGQAKMWQESKQKFLETEKIREQNKQAQLKSHLLALKQQMDEKVEKKKSIDRLYSLRMSLNESKLTSIY